MEPTLADQLAAARSSHDLDELVELGCELADAGEHVDAAWCFQRAASFGDAVAAFDLGNELVALGRDRAAVDAYEQALAGGETDAWLNLGQVLEGLGDLAGALRAYEQGQLAGDHRAGIARAFLLRETDDRAAAARVLDEVARAGSALADAIAACWQYDTTLDPGLETRLRAGADLYPGARSDLADVLRRSGRIDEAVAVLLRGADLDESESFVPLGNLYADVLDDPAAAEAAYRRGIAVGDVHCHHNLAVLLEGQDRPDEARHHYELGAVAGDALARQALKKLYG